MGHSSLVESTEKPLSAANMEHLSKEKHTDYSTTTRSTTTLYGVATPPYEADITDLDLETILKIYTRKNLRPSDTYGKK